MTLTLPPTDALNVDMFGVHLGAHGVPAIVAASVIFITLAIVSLMRYKWMLDAGAAGASGRARIAGVDLHAASTPLVQARAGLWKGGAAPQ